MDYTNKMESELSNLKVSNQAYFKEMVVKAGLKTFVCDEEALSETLYNMVCDLKTAEEDGLSGEDYFGKNPQKMMDHVLAETPRRSLVSIFLVSSVVGAFIFALSLLLDFIWRVPYQFRFFSYLLDGIQVMLGVLLLFLIGSKIVQKRLKKGWGIAFFILTYSVLIKGVIRYLKDSYAGFGVLELSPVMQLVLALLVSLVIVFITSRDRYGRILSTTFIVLFLAGIYKYLTFLPQHPGIPFVILVLGVVLGIIIAKKGKQ